jgi:hypothetical protein
MVTRAAAAHRVRLRAKRVANPRQGDFAKLDYGYGGGRPASRRLPSTGNRTTGSAAAEFCDL